MSAAAQRALTDLERQVALLVGWGGSNRDVAEALGIDANAVERHLARVYRKLGIRARAELWPLVGLASYKHEGELQPNKGGRS
jgi:DNA-binding CsgD family transcriptional regulator